MPVLEPMCLWHLFSSLLPEIKKFYVRICLNARLLFKPLMSQAKQYQRDVTDNVAEFFLRNYNCAKAKNGCCQWNCVSQKCSQCKSIKPLSFEFASSEQKIKLSQFEIT